jgi:hypothetical protein
MFLHTGPHTGDVGSYDLDGLEHEARAAMDGVRGEAITDAEWPRVCSRLLEFAILRRWESQQRNPARGNGEATQMLKAA